MSVLTAVVLASTVAALLGGCSGGLFSASPDASTTAGQANGSPAPLGGGASSSLTPKISATPSEGSAPLLVQFSYTLPGVLPATGVVNCCWDFGDDTSSVDRKPTHVFTAPGEYIVTLTVVWNVPSGKWFTLSGSSTTYVTATSGITPNKLYVADPPRGTIVRADLDGTGAENLGTLRGKLTVPAGIALDVAGGKMYVTSMSNSGGTSYVVQANLDGTGARNLGALGGILRATAAYGIALDLVHGRMYVAGFSPHGIGVLARANLDGTGAQNLGTLNGILESPVGIALDVAAGKMYVADLGRFDSSSGFVGNGRLVRANLDGTGAEDLGDLGGTLTHPVAVALDIADGKIYVADYESGKIVRADLDGTSPEDLGNLEGALGRPFGIALDLVHRKIYATDLFDWPGKVVRAGLDGTSAENLGDLAGALSPAGIALWVEP